MFETFLYVKSLQINVKMKAAILFCCVVLMSWKAVVSQKVVEIQTATTDVHGGDGTRVGIELINREFKECNVDELDNPDQDDLERGIRPRNFCLTSNCLTVHCSRCCGCIPRTYYWGVQRL